MPATPVRSESSYTFRQFYDQMITMRFADHAINETRYYI